MPNKYYYGNYSNKGGAKPKKGVSGPSEMPERAINWPGCPGPTQPRSRSNGVPMTGHMGPFQHNKKGL